MIKWFRVKLDNVYLKTPYIISFCVEKTETSSNTTHMGPVFGVATQFSKGSTFRGDPTGLNITTAQLFLPH